MKVTFSSISETGPRPVNEDCLDCWVADSGETVAAVADGLGGMGGGDNASRLAVTELRSHLEKFGISEQTLFEGALLPKDTPWATDDTHVFEKSVYPCRGCAKRHK